MNILEAYFQQKEIRDLRKKKKVICLNCIHSSVYDSDFNDKIIERRVYCRKWKSVVRVGQAGACSSFEFYENKRKKKRNKRRKKRKKK